MVRSVVSSVAIVLALAGRTLLAMPDAAAAATGANAVDPTTEVPAGGLIFSSLGSLVLDRKDLLIGIDKVRLTYAVRNPDARDLRGLMSFPLPDIDMAALDNATVAVPSYDPQNPTNFLAFWAVIDGKNVEPEVDIRALALGYVDVTEPLTKAGVPLYPLASETIEKLQNLPASVKTDLQARSIVALQSNDIEPYWTLRTAFHWPVIYPAGRTITIQHGYRPIVGTISWTEDSAPKLIETYCVDPAMASNLTRRANDGKPATVYLVHYQPSHNHQLKGPASAFTLTLEKPADGSQLSTCKKGFEPAGPRLLQWRAADHTQDEPIAVLIVE